MKRILPALLLAACTAPAALAGSAAPLLAALEADASRQAGAPLSGSPSRGDTFFHTRRAEWSCSSCHTADPRQTGRHVVTGKNIRPMAPAVNPDRFVDRAKTDKWFRRNCQDVLGRPCSLQEQADVVAYLASL
ncbi:MAG: DUF1924 domain-containing protein [Pseudomonadota bacterium]